MMLILGAGGHAKEVLDICLEKDDRKGYVFLDTTLLNDSLFFDTYAIFSSWNNISKEIQEFYLGVGGIALRKQFVKDAIDRGLLWQGLRSKYMQLGKYDLDIASTVDIMQGVSISSSVKIGKGTLLNRNVNIHHDVTIGEFCELAPSCQVLGKAQIGNNVFIGTGAIILPSVKIADNVIIGAGTVVNKDIESNQKVVGNPCRQLI